MFKSGRLFQRLPAVLLALALFPFSAVAITEDTVESAPEVSLPEEEAGDVSEEAAEGGNQDDQAYRPYQQALPERGTVDASLELDLPRLTDAELALVQELMAARAEGQQPEFTDRRYAEPEKVFEAGVYPVDPEEFGGNTFYVILPYFQMDRNQLLSLISAFEELGIPFCPDSLNSTNCVRGLSLLGNSATRYLSGDEQNRMEEIRKQIRYDIFDRDAFTAVSSCRSVQVQLPGYSNSAYDYLEPFCFYPYRAMTDNELATFALAQETVWEIRPDLLEKKARQYAHRVFPLPLSMKAHDVSRYAYSGDYIEFRNYFSLESENNGGLYDSPDETPFDIMVEQDLIRNEDGFPDEASVVRILIDYPAMNSDRPEGRSGCGEEELKAAARRWAERYLLIPEEDILSEWAFDSRNEDWGTVQLRLLTAEWLVCLEMFENNAMYCQCCIYNRDRAVEFDDWVLKNPDETGADTAVQDFDRNFIDNNARQSVQGILNLPEEMTLTGFSKDEEGYIQYRADYSFTSGESAGKSESGGRRPESMIVYQTPYFTETAGLRLDCFFLSYPGESDILAGLTEEEYLAAARKWADRTLKIPAEEILKDWSVDLSDTAIGTVTCQLKTVNWMVYVQVDENGECCWAGIYRRNNPD